LYIVHVGGTVIVHVANRILSFCCQDPYRGGLGFSDDLILMAVALVAVVSVAVINLGGSRILRFVLFGGLKSDYGPQSVRGSVTLLELLAKLA
jgi:hypothetical protein